MCNFLLDKRHIVPYYYVGGLKMYTRRNRFLMFILMRAFSAPYDLYWISSVQNEVCRNEKKGMSGFLTSLLVLCTFGIYSIVWQFRTSGILKRQGAEEKRIKMAICAFFMIGIITNPIIIQGQMNQLAGQRISPCVIRKSIR